MKNPDFYIKSISIDRVNVAQIIATGVVSGKLLESLRRVIAAAQKEGMENAPQAAIYERSKDETLMRILQSNKLSMEPAFLFSIMKVLEQRDVVATQFRVGSDVEACKSCLEYLNSELKRLLGLW